MTTDTGTETTSTGTPGEADLTETTDLRRSADAAGEPAAGDPHMFDAHTPPPVDPESRPARHRTKSLLTDTERAAFLQQWEAVQTGFVTSPDGTADAAGQLVDDVARQIVRSIGAVRDQALRPVDEAALVRTANDPAEVGTETQRARLLQCREAFSLLIDC